MSINTEWHCFFGVCDNSQFSWPMTRNKAELLRTELMGWMTRIFRFHEPVLYLKSPARNNPVPHRCTRFNQVQIWQRPCIQTRHVKKGIAASMLSEYSYICRVYRWIYQGLRLSRWRTLTAFDNWFAQHASGLYFFVQVDTSDWEVRKSWPMVITSACWRCRLSLNGLLLGTARWNVLSSERGFKEFCSLELRYWVTTESC